MKYERLTFRHKSVVDGTEQIGYTEKLIPCYRKEAMILERLAELEDKIEQGTLIELPCKVGDTVYAVYNNKVHPVTPWRIWYDGNFFYLNSSECIYDLLWGSSVFTSCAEAKIEAEKRLEELQNGQAMEQ